MSTENAICYHENEFMRIIRDHFQLKRRNFDKLSDEEKLQLIKHRLYSYENECDANDLIIMKDDQYNLVEAFLVIAGLDDPNKRNKSCIEIFEHLFRNACENIRSIVNEFFEKLDRQVDEMDALNDPDAWKYEDGYLNNGLKGAL